jgi:anti-anti-sigma regulatory factor
MRARNLASYHHVGNFRVDLSEVTFFAAASVRMLLATADTARRRGVPLQFEPLSRSVRTVLDATGTRAPLGC